MLQTYEDKGEQERTKNSTWEIESGDDTNYPQWIPDLQCIRMHITVSYRIIKLNCVKEHGRSCNNIQIE